MPNEKQLTVFVVDDELVIANTLKIILNSAGFTTRAFCSPLEALEAAKADPPDLLVSDVMMPEITGVQLAVALKGTYPACKVLLFSGQPETANLLEDARNRGYDFDLLPKPIHPSDLLVQLKG
jgi:DNA-binding NtrC family response regulator